MLRPATFACLGLVLLVACEGKKTGTAEPPPKVPVTVTTLELSDPARDGRRMGVAQPYRSEEVSFEVSGRVMMVRDVGEELVGPVSCAVERPGTGSISRTSPGALRGDGGAGARVESGGHDPVGLAAGAAERRARVGRHEAVCLRALALDSVERPRTVPWRPLIDMSATRENG